MGRAWLGADGGLQSALDVGHRLLNLGINVADADNLALGADAGLTREKHEVANNVALPDHVLEVLVG